MARDYGRTRTVHKRKSGSRQFLMVLLAFLIGYLTASFFDFASFSHWVNTQLAKRENQDAAKTNAHPQAAKVNNPKFEFYTLLANKRATNTQNFHAKATTPPPLPPPSQNAKPLTTVALAPQQTAPESVKANIKPAEQKLDKESYIIQVGSFKTQDEAERMKVKLIMKGFAVRIVPLTEPRGNWFRVVIGPYANRNEAQRVQTNFAKNERVVGMIRKLDA
jgi:cell division protein FtsN